MTPKMPPLFIFLYVSIINGWGLMDFMPWRTIKSCLTLFRIPAIYNIYLAPNKGLLHDYSVSILFSFSLWCPKYWTQGKFAESLQPTFQSSPHAPGTAFSDAQFVPLRNKIPAVRARNPSPEQHVSPRVSLPLCLSHQFLFLLHLTRTWVGKHGWKEGMCRSKGWKLLSKSTTLRTHRKQTSSGWSYSHHVQLPFYSCKNITSGCQFLTLFHFGK